MYSGKQAPFLVTETNASSIGFSWDSRPAYDGQWRQAAWALVARGARMIGYWHWHTLHFGTETYWGGILPHSGRPGRTFWELARVGGELRSAADVLDGLTPDADVAIVFDLPSRWIMQRYPALSHPDGTPDERAYQGIIEPFYRGAFDAGLQARLLHTAQLPPAGELARTHPVLVAAGLYVADDATLDRLREYAHAGGHLVIGPRTGYADHEARARTDRMPARLADAAGAWYDEFSTIHTPVPLVAADPGFPVPDGAAATRWIDGLQPTDATVLAGYRHPHFGRWPAITTRAFGRGRITHVGTVPDQRLAEALMRWAVPEPASWTGLPETVTGTGATAADGRRLRFLHNWSWTRTRVEAPVDCADVLTGKEIPAGTAIDLSEWAVRVLVEERPGT
jgi:beta-galactosidase